MHRAGEDCHCRSGKRSANCASGCSSNVCISLIGFHFVPHSTHFQKLHGVTIDNFWDVVFSAAEQAAEDFSIDLKLDRFDPEDDPEVLHTKMAMMMISHCQSNVDGLFVTIPSETVIEAIQECQKLRVPVLSINSGADTSNRLGLMAHIGQVEANAGYGAGKRLISTGKITRALCVIHLENNQAMFERCGGFKRAVEEAGSIEYLGELVAAQDNDSSYRASIENRVKDDGNWEG